MIKKSTKYIIKLSLVLIALGLLVICSFTIWVITGPREVPALSKYVEGTLSSISSDINVKIEKTVIAWNGWDRAFSLRASNVELYNDTEDSIAHFPEIVVGIKLIKILKGSSLFSDLTILRPVIQLNSSKKEEYVKPEQNMQFYKSLLASFIGIGKKNQLPVSNIRFKDAEIHINNGSSDIVWLMDEGYIKLEEGWTSSEILSEFTINFGNSICYFKVETSPMHNNEISPKITFNNLPSFVAQDIFPYIGWLEQIDIVTSGYITTTFDINGKIREADFDIEELSGNIDLPEIFSRQLSIKQLAFKGDISKQMSLITINKLQANMEGPVINIEGTIQNHDIWPLFAPDINLKIKADNINISHVKNYWPIGKAGKSRNWITEHFKTGRINKVFANVNLTKDDLTSLPLPNDAMELRFTFTDANLDIHHDFPAPLKNARGDAILSAKKMTINVKNATALNTKLNNGKVIIPDMWEQPATMTITGKTNGSAEELVKLITPYIKQDKDLKLNLGSIKGSAHSDFSFEFPTKPELDKDEFSYQITTKLNNITAGKIIKNGNLEEGDFLINASNNFIQLKGNGLLNSQKLNYEFTRDKNNIKTHAIKGDVINLTALPFYDFSDSPYLKNNIGLDFNIKQTLKEIKFSGTINATDALLSVPKLGYEKKPGIKTTIAVSGKYKENLPIEIGSFKITGYDTDINGNIVLSPNFKDIKSAYLDKAVFGGNNFSLDYETTKNSSKMTISGNSLNLSNSNLAEFFSDKNDKEKFASKSVTADINYVFMKHGKSFKDVKFELLCDAKLCSKMNLYGKLDDENFVVSHFKPIEGKRSLLLESDNAGAALKAFGLSQNIKGGFLEISAISELVNGSIQSSGHMIINDFKALKMPVLGKLLTLASPKGITDLLEGGGITFEVFEAPFAVKDGIISIKNAKTSGSSLGITTEGRINTNSGELDLEGVVVPAHTLNSIVGNIPLIGNLLIGGEGEGVIATKYKIKGNYEDPDISVNPLTMIAPGFLRNIFDIFSRDSKK